MTTQCPKCKRVYSNGKFVKTKHTSLIPGAFYKLCPECRRTLNYEILNSNNFII